MVLKNVIVILEAISIGLARCLQILAPIVFGIIAAVAIAAAKGIGNIEPFRKKIEAFKQVTNNQDEI